METLPTPPQPPTLIYLQTGSGTTTTLKFTTFTADHARVLMDLVNFARTKLSANGTQAIDNSDINSEFVGYTLTRNETKCTLTAPAESASAHATDLFNDLNGNGDGDAKYLMEHMYDPTDGYSRVELYKALSNWAADEWLKKAGFQSVVLTNAPITLGVFDTINTENDANGILYAYYSFCSTNGVNITVPTFSPVQPQSTLVTDFKTDMETPDFTKYGVANINEFKSLEFASALYKKLSETVINPITSTSSHPMNVLGKGPSSSSSQVVAPFLYTDSFYPSKRSKKRKGSRTRKKYSL